MVEMAQLQVAGSAVNMEAMVERILVVVEVVRALVQVVRLVMVVAVSQ